ncbi:MAG: energy-coupling factor ABC transporter permease [Thermoleophilia bacterium]
MHIPEGLIPAQQAAAWYAPPPAFLGAGLVGLKRRLALHGDEPVSYVWGAAFASFLPTQVPLAIAEALFTAGVVVFIANQRAEILEGVVVRS